METHNDEKQVEAISSTEVVPGLGKQVNTTTEKRSTHSAIAAAAAGLINDGCEFPCQTLVQTDNTING